MDIEWIPVIKKKPEQNGTFLCTIRIPFCNRVEYFVKHLFYCVKDDVWREPYGNYGYLSWNRDDPGYSSCISCVTAWSDDIILPYLEDYNKG